MKPTTKDLARVAGVSLATVDRVLNNRPNVSPRARTRVHEAIDETGFVRNSVAALLARNRPHRFRFLLPDRGDEYLNEIERQVGIADGALRRDMISVEAVRIAMHDPHGVADHLGRLRPEEVDGLAIMSPQSPQVRDAIARLHERGIRTIPFLSGRRDAEGESFVGADNFAAGATAGRILGSFLRGCRGSVMVIAETMRSLDSIERRLGFDAVMNEYFPALAILPSLETRGDRDRAKAVIGETLRHRGDVVGVYVVGSEARIPVSTIAAARSLERITLVAHERTPFTERALMRGEIDAVIAQDPGHAVRSATRILRAQLQNVEPIAAQERIRNEILLKENL